MMNLDSAIDHEIYNCLLSQIVKYILNEASGYGILEKCPVFLNSVDMDILLSYVKKQDASIIVTGIRGIVFLTVSGDIMILPIV